MPGIFMFFPCTGMLKLSGEKKASGINCDLVCVILTVLKLQPLLAAQYNAYKKCLFVK